MKNWYSIICLIFSLSALFSPLAQANQHMAQFNDMDMAQAVIQANNQVIETNSVADNCLECIDHSNAMVCLDLCLTMASAILVESILIKEPDQVESVQTISERSRGISPTVEISPPINLS